MALEFAGEEKRTETKEVALLDVEAICGHVSGFL